MALPRGAALKLSRGCHGWRWGVAASSGMHAERSCAPFAGLVSEHTCHTGADVTTSGVTSFVQRVAASMGSPEVGQAGQVRDRHTNADVMHRMTSSPWTFLAQAVPMSTSAGSKKGEPGSFQSATIADDAYVIKDSLNSSRPDEKQADVESVKARQSSQTPGGKGRLKGGKSRAAAASGTGGADGGDSTEEELRKVKRARVNEALARINKKFGVGTCTSAGDSSLLEVETFPTGILPLDLALGGGWPKGKIVEIYGHESTGKTTIALYAIKELQKRGGFATFIDAEHSLNRAYMERLGIVFDETLNISTPDTGEQAVNIADELISSGGMDLIVFDSVAAMTPRNELADPMGEGSLGQLARLMSTACRRLQGMASRQGTTLMFLNQIRNTIGGYGNPETTAGGKALKFAAFLRCELRAADRKKDTTGDLSYTCKVRLAKSKMGAVGSMVEFEMRVGHGISDESVLLGVAENMKLIKRDGSWYKMDGGAFQGAERAVEHLRANPGFMRQLDAQVRAMVKQGKVSRSVGDSEMSADGDEGGEEYEDQDEDDPLERAN